MDEADNQTAVEMKRQPKSDITLADCFNEFKITETLDEDNKWYCNKCKEFVQADKTLEIHRIPRIMIVTLKRFKTSRSRFGSMFGGGSKIDTLVDFPLEGLDMSNLINSEEQKQTTPLTYDCFAVSNHMGGTGGGHYTAYAKSPINNQWFSFNDSSVKRINATNPEDVVISSSAYSLFYRRRDPTVDLTAVDFGAIKQIAHTEFLENLEKKRKAAKETKE